MEEILEIIMDKEGSTKVHLKEFEGLWKGGEKVG